MLFRKYLSVLSVILLSLSGCYSLSQDSSYQGPAPRSPELEAYYAYTKQGSYSSFTEEVISDSDDYTLKRIKIQTIAGETVVDYFKRKVSDENLILVFPVLGGKKNFIENHFADVIARKGYDSAIVHRSEDFKKPDNFDQIEEVFRKNIIRDRIALDFFEKEYGKKTFGTFGISRGAINVAMTAGVEPRLKYNVLALGGTDLVGMFQNTDQRRINKYRQSVMNAKGISEEEFYAQLKEMLKSDPNFLSPHMDARNTMLILGLFDSTVPIKYGRKLREKIGNPKTVYLVGNHYTSAAFTQVIKVFPPVDPICIFPLDYIETVGLDFYDRKFKGENTWWRLLPIKIIQTPIDLFADTINWLVD